MVGNYLLKFKIKITVINYGFKKKNLKIIRLNLMLVGHTILTNIFNIILD